MAFVKKALGAVVGGLLGGPLGFAAGLAATGTFKGKKKSQSGMPMQASRDDARALADREMELARRRGAASDIITGTTGAEAAAGSIGRLVVGS